MALTIADALTARVIMRTQLCEGIRVSTNAIDSVRVLIPCVIEVLKACRVGDGNAAGGILAETDPMFACLLGGADASRILHCIGAWTRRVDVAMALNSAGVTVQRDETIGQNVARYNAWPVEAEAQLQSVTGLLQRTAALSLASMPIYALQNTLSDVPNCRSAEVDARLCEALASFARTLAFGKALGLTGSALNPVASKFSESLSTMLAALVRSAIGSVCARLMPFINDLVSM